MTSTGSAKPPRQLDELRLVGDADELVRRGCDDLLAGQGAAAALGQATVRIDLIGAVNVDAGRRRRIQIEYRYAVTGEAPRARLAAGYGRIEVVLDAGEVVDEEVGGGTRADADDGLSCEPAFDVADRSRGNAAFQRILHHAVELPTRPCL